MCYDEELLQQVIDGEYAGDPKEIQEHMQSCKKCKAAYEALLQNQKYVEEKLTTGMELPTLRPMELAFKMNQITQKKKGVYSMNAKIKRFTAVAATIALCAGMFTLQPVRTRAAALLKLFRVNEIQGISIHQSDLQKVDELIRKGKGEFKLENFISMKVDSKGEKLSQEKLDLEKLKKKDSSFLIVPEKNSFQYGSKDFIPEGDISIKLNVPSINEFLQFAGESVTLPESLDGKEFVIHTGNILDYNLKKEAGGDTKTLSISQMDLPTLNIPEDVNEKALIHSLLSLNLLPENIKQQLQGISDLTSTLPIPYDADKQEKKEILIRGQKAIVITSTESNFNYFNICFKENNKLFLVYASRISLEEAIDMLENEK